MTLTFRPQVDRSGPVAGVETFFTYAAVRTSHRTFAFVDDPNRDWLVVDQGDDWIELARGGETRRIHGPAIVTLITKGR